jgi:hypothetical protein
MKILKCFFKKRKEIVVKKTHVACPHVLLFTRMFSLWESFSSSSELALGFELLFSMAFVPRGFLNLSSSPGNLVPKILNSLPLI